MARVMIPQAFIDLLDEWIDEGGGFPRTGPHDITTIGEAQALCRAVASRRIYAADEFGRFALSDLMRRFEASEMQEATHHLRDHGLPILRRILLAALNRTMEDSADRKGVTDRRDAHLLVVKVLAAYQQSGDAPLIVQAARHPDLADGYLWATIFGMIAERHPEAVEICEQLSDPLPNGSIATAYLDFANRLARSGAISRHPFDTEAGISRLSAFLADRNPDNSGSAISAAASIPFVNAGVRECLLDSAHAHPDTHVRMEGAWAMARLGSEIGRRRLVEFCLDPRYSDRAILYLDELGLKELVPAETQQPDFRAMAEMAGWLEHPMEFGRPPDEIVQYDTRELKWPPTGKRERLWLFKFRYDARGRNKDDAGIRLVGPTTFALRDTTPDLSPEDVYGLHCCLELREVGDPRGPKERLAAAGRKLIAEMNPGFARG